MHWMMQGTRAEFEGRKRGGFWTFNVVKAGDRAGETISLVRCSKESRADVDKWLAVSPMQIAMLKPRCTVSAEQNALLQQLAFS